MDTDTEQKIDLLKEKLGLTEENLTEEAKAARAEAPSDSDGISGADINWDDYNLDPKYAHYYPRATLKNTEDGPAWLVNLAEFRSASKPYRSSSPFEKNGEPRELGDYLTWMVNGAEGWRIAQVMDNGIGFAGVLCQRQVTLRLPDPLLIESAAEQPITDDAIRTTEGKSLDWAGLPKDEEFVEGEDYRGESEVNAAGSTEISAT